MAKTARTLPELTEKAKQVSDIYAKAFAIERNDMWYLAKLTEELGELTAAYLKHSGQGRTNGASADELLNELNREAADVMAHLLLFADHAGLDIESALDEKWFARLSALPACLHMQEDASDS
ncbi:hypothetical protein [Polycladidibacter hongkongensis]|uniref:hypothetical protein n=1 Tax=Polycladidibacter hongkongensis TaxID=1647556 RepID=UPI000831FE34|nr:hypothetical protein [Pseudovibrio hongkongensis]